MGRKTIARMRGKPVKSIVFVKDMSWGLIWRRGSVGEKGKVVRCRGAEDRTGLGINSGKSSVRNPETETECMRRRAESTGGCVNLNTVTKIRRSCVRDTFIAESTVFPLCIILCRIGSLQVDKYLLFYKDTRIFICQWRKNAHRNLSWRRPIHTGCHRSEYSKTEMNESDCLDWPAPAWERWRKGAGGKGGDDSAGSGGVRVNGKQL